MYFKPRLGLGGGRMNKYHLDSVVALKYATEPNSYIYRPIVRYLYNKHMGFEHYNTTLSDVFRMLKENEVVNDEYTETNLQEALNQLETWEVIKSRQEKQSGMTIEEFKKKRYLYQITDLGLEVDALLLRIDDLDEKLMGSLDSRQFSRLFKFLETFKDIDAVYVPPDKASEIWMNVFETHKTLRTNATNYLFHIQEAERANLFNTELFLNFKDTFMQYLGTYISELDRVKYKIYKLINEIDEAHVDKYIDVLIEANKPNSILYEDFSEEKLKISLKNKWVELKTWFLGTKGGTSDIEVLSDKTKEAIRLIVTYANRLSDSMTNTQNRVTDYQALAKKFIDSSSLKNAHELYAAAFGTSHSRSLHVTEEISLNEDGQYSNADEIWNTDIKPYQTPNMSNRGPKGKTKASVIKNNKLERQRRVMESLEKKREEERKMKELIKEGKIILSEIKEPLEPFQRKVLLKWIMRTTNMRLGKTKKNTFRTETGLTLKANYRSKEVVTIPCKDGALRGFDIEFVVEGERYDE